MGSCKFLKTLNRLRKSSCDSIDNVEKFDDFKEYMHVSRKAEEDLKEIIRSINLSGKKTLVLLCGSAGDGKSHLLSYLKNSDEEHLIQDYVIYNDATESSAPLKTAIETLYELLASFKDENLDLPGKNTILAINLGVLSNFIESKNEGEYRTLKDYVESENILTTKIENNIFDKTKHFQHVSFSDYHMFSLTSEGVHAEYIENVLDKVFSKKEKNIFYNSYKEDCLTCPLALKCPVNKNYEYMMNKTRQRSVAKLLVKTIIQNKMILTTREILNFIYDILIAQNFNGKLPAGNEVNLKEYLNQITPTLLFDSNDVTTLLNMIKKYNPLLVRTEDADESAMSYHISSDISKEINKQFSMLEYKTVICNTTSIEKINGNKDLKAKLFNLIVRIDAIDNGSGENEIYTKYLSDLYIYNSGKGKKLGNLYNMVEQAVSQWCGSDEDGNLCLNNKYGGFMLFEKVTFKASIVHLPHTDDREELQRFDLSIVTVFEDLEGGHIVLNIDYSLYELMYRLNQGYIQTAEDRNNHADFISFINRILETGSAEEKISIISKNGKKANISKGMFECKFKVVK